MADLKDISTVIASALEEANVSGKLHVRMEGQKQVVPIGEHGDELTVKVVVVPNDDHPDRDA